MPTSLGLANVPDGSSVFLDTNVIVYASFPTLPLFAVARNRLEQLEAAGALFTISRQVLREFLAAVSRPRVVEPELKATTLRGILEEWQVRCHLVEDDAAVTTILLRYLEQPGACGKQVHDANIAATLERYRIPYLLTHNGRDFIRYTGQFTVLPLVP